MTKSLFVDPAQVRASGQISVAPIPVNAYKLDFDTEVVRYGRVGLIAMLHDMIVIRQFETMLNSIKTTGGWNGVSYTHLGPAHLSAGQEAAAVGQAVELDADDLIFGSHRSHGEIIAKSFAAARKMDHATLQTTMETFLDGDTLRAASSIAHETHEELLENFIMFGTLAEIFARKDGFNRGMGGSMHAFFPPFGSMPNNAIVGGSAPIAQGAALFKRINRVRGIVVANIGDASMGCGPVWEAMTFAAMDQFRTLWRAEDGGNPPILFNFFNNFYGMGGQPDGETMGFDILARVGAGNGGRRGTDSGEAAPVSPTGSGCGSGSGRGGESRTGGSGRGLATWSFVSPVGPPILLLDGVGLGSGVARFSRTGGVGVGPATTVARSATWSFVSLMGPLIRLVEGHVYVIASLPPRDPASRLTMRTNNRQSSDVTPIVLQTRRTAGARNPLPRGGGQSRWLQPKPF